MSRVMVGVKEFLSISRYAVEKEVS